VDSPERLVERHCPWRTVVIRTADPRAAGALGRVAGVESVGREDAVVTVRGRSVAVMTGVIGCLAEQRIAVTDFRTIVPTLEDVFLKLTGHSVRE
jgi:ABC-2 type transport system ATP-binding protein